MPNDSRPSERLISRREALWIGAGAAGAVLLASCHSSPSVDTVHSAPWRLSTRPSSPSKAPPIGRSALGLGSGRDGILYVPSSYDPAKPAPLVLMLHGAGQSAEIGIRPFLSLADAAGIVLLAPDSRGMTWDFLRGSYGVDVASIDRALSYVF